MPDAALVTHDGEKRQSRLAALAEPVVYAGVELGLGAPAMPCRQVQVAEHAQVMCLFTGALRLPD